jgi:hypothetical protein
VIEHMPEPTKTKLRHLRDQLAAHADQPLPSELYQELQGLIWWADWWIDRHLTRDQIRYQRWYVVSIFIRQYIAQHGTTRGSRKYAYHAAAKELTGPYAGAWSTMKEDYLFEEHAPSADPRSVRYRETLERRAREADRKRARRQRGR